MIDGNTYAINKHLNDQEDYDALQEVTTELEQAEARIEELESKLAKAVEAIFEAIYLLDPDEEDIAKGTGIYRIVTTFKELKGQDDE